MSETWGKVDIQVSGESEIHLVPVLDGDVLSTHQPSTMCKCLPEVLQDKTWVTNSRVVNHREPGWAGCNKERVN